MTTDALGTSGREAIPLEYQAPLKRAERKRAIAQQMAQMAMKANPTQMVSGMAVKQSPVEHLVKALAGYLGFRGLSQADELEEASLGKYSRDSAADLAAVQQKAAPSQRTVRDPGAILDKDFTQGDESLPTKVEAVPGDVRGAVAQALASRFPQTRALGANMQKDRSERVKQIADALKERDPLSAARLIQSGNLEDPLPGLPQPAITFGKTPEGKEYAATTDVKGQPSVRFAPVPSSTNVAVNTAPRLGAKVNEQQAGHFAYGGKGREDADAIEKSMQTTQETLQALTRNPAMGAGAEGFQVLRKWAEVLGADMKDITTNTEQMKMLLGERALAALGGKLGAQVSDADRKFIMENLGQINSDPEAVRRILLTTAKYQMAAQNKYNQGVDLMQGRLEGEATLPRLTGGIRFADDEDAAAFEEVYRGGVPRRRYGKIVPKPVPGNPPPEIRFVEPVPR